MNAFLTNDSAEEMTGLVERDLARGVGRGGGGEAG